MRVGQVSSRELRTVGHRLNGGFFLTEDEQAIRALRSWSGPTSLLNKLCREGGIFSGPIYRKIPASGPDHGLAYVSARDVFKMDIRPNGYISHKHGALLDQLVLSEKTILLTCSGMNLGESVWVRSDMAGLAGSGDLIRIQVDPVQAAPGFVFAFLDSRYGRVSVRKLIYGGHIKHVAPADVGRVVVPLLGPKLERRVDDLVERAATLRVESSRLLEDAKKHACVLWGIDPSVKYRAATHPDVRIVQASTLGRTTSRFDAFFYGSAATASDDTIASIARRLPVKRIGDAEVTNDVFETTRFGRVSVEDERFGVPLLSISDMMRGDPKAESFISRKQAQGVRAIVSGGWLILPRVGQLQGVFGTVGYVARHLDGVAVSDNNIRIVPLGADEGAYLWAALSTDLLYQQIVRRACGASIPYIDAKRVADISVPWPAREKRLSIAEGVKQAMEMRSLASKCEADAVKEVEKGIENGAN